MVFKASRIKIERITYDLDKPITNKTFYETTRRKSKDQAVEALVKNGYITMDKEMKRQRDKEDAVIRALKKMGGLFVP